MAYRIRSRRTMWLISLAALALAIGLALRPVVGADFPGCRTGNCPNCPVNSKYFGYYPTLWRRWPGSEPQPQPAPPPSTGGVTVPPVEPPPPAEETENKAKTGASEAPAGSGGSAANSAPDMAPVQPNLPPPGDDPNARLPNQPQPDKGTAPPPMGTPQKLNQLPSPRRNPAPAVSEAPRDPTALTGHREPTWPPTNSLRGDELHASFLLPDGTSLPKSTKAIPSYVPAAAAASVSPTARPEMNRPKAIDSQLMPEWTAPAAFTASPASGFVLPPQTTTAPPQHASQPFAAEPAAPQTNSRFQQSGPTDVWHPDAASSAPSKSPFASNSEMSNHSLTPTRIPFIPATSLRDPLPPIDPRLLTDRGTAAGVTPADATTNGLTPPSKVNEIAVPMIPLNTLAKVQSPPNDKVDLDHLSLIDPVAIGKSLEASKTQVDFNTSGRGASSPQDGFQFAAGISPRFDPHPSQTGGLSKADFQFADPAVPSQRASINPLEANKPLAFATGVRPVAAPPLAKAHAASLIVSDDEGPNGVVQAATFVGSSGPKPTTASRGNPLRGGSSDSAEVLSTDSPSSLWPAANSAAPPMKSGWINPLRSGN